MMTIILLLTALLQNQNGSIEGVVRDAATNTGIDGASIVAAPGISTTTDETGRFRISLAPGEYTVRAQRNGYFGDTANGIAVDSANRRVVVAPSQQITGFAMMLHPSGVITGQLLDRGGLRRSGLTVTAMRIVYDNGRRILGVVRTAQTDDRGEFRLYWVPPGEYILTGTPRMNYVTTAADGRFSVRTFFPGVTDVSKAVPAFVKSGTETSGLNFAIETLGAVDIQGRIVNAPSAAPTQPGAMESAFIAPPRIALASRGSVIDESMSSFGNNATAKERSEGVFRFRGVQPGAYDLFVHVGDGSAVFRIAAGATVPIDVGTQSIAGLTVNVHPPVDLKGRVVINGSASPINIPSIGLRPLGNLPPLIKAVMPPGALVSPAGEFTIAGVLPASYAFHIQVPNGLFLADVRQGDRSIKAEPGITVGSEVPEPVQIIFGRDGGSIRGRIKPPANQPALDTTVVLVPEMSLRANPLLYRSFRPAEDGTFELKDVAPGNYKLFAWDGVQSTAWMNAEFLKPHEEGGMPVRIDQKEISGVIVTVHPANAP